MTGGTFPYGGVDYRTIAATPTASAVWPSTLPLELHEAAAFRTHFTAPDLPYRFTDIWYWCPEQIFATQGEMTMALNGTYLQVGGGFTSPPRERSSWEPVAHALPAYHADSLLNRGGSNLVAFTAGPYAYSGGAGWDVRVDPPGQQFPWNFGTLHTTPTAWITWLFGFKDLGVVSTRNFAWVMG